MTRSFSESLSNASQHRHERLVRPTAQSESSPEELLCKHMSKGSISLNFSFTSCCGSCFRRGGPEYTSTVANNAEIYANLEIRAQPGRKSEFNGKAQPFLTTGGEAVPKRKSCSDKRSFSSCRAA